MLRNKCYPNFCLVNLLSHHIVPTKTGIFPRLCQEPRWASHVSIQFYLGLSVLEWLLSGSRLKMLYNKCYYKFLPTKPDIYPRLCQEPRWDSQHPIFPPTFRYWSDFAMIVLLSSLSFTGSWTWDTSLFSYFYGKDGEDRTRDLTVHNLTSCLRRHCEEIN